MRLHRSRDLFLPGIVVFGIELNDVSVLYRKAVPTVAIIGDLAEILGHVDRSVVSAP